MVSIFDFMKAKDIRSKSMTALNSVDWVNTFFNEQDVDTIQSLDKDKHNEIKQSMEVYFEKIAECIVDRKTEIPYIENASRLNAVIDKTKPLGFYFTLN